jgi:hypothetical protein
MPPLLPLPNVGCLEKALDVGSRFTTSASKASHPRQRCKRLRLSNTCVPAVALEGQNVLTEVTGQLDHGEWQARGIIRRLSRVASDGVHTVLNRHQYCMRLAFGNLVTLFRRRIGGAPRNRGRRADAGRRRDGEAEILKRRVGAPLKAHSTHT